MTTTSLLRARLFDAETRAFTAERSLRRSHADLRKTRLVLGEVLDDLDAARHGGAKLARMLRRLAARHLGEGASRADVDALMAMWMAEDLRQTKKAAAIAPIVFNGKGITLWLNGKRIGGDDHG